MGQEGEHMVEKTDTRGDLDPAAAVEVQLQDNIRFPGLPLQHRRSHGHKVSTLSGPGPQHLGL